MINSRSPMQKNFDFWFRTLLVALLVTWIWAFWTSAQTNETELLAPENASPSLSSTDGVADGNQLTNAVPPSDTSTNLLAGHSPLKSRGFTFWLDQVNFLQNSLMGIPLWQYLASLIYIFLAFLVSKFLDHFLTGQLNRWVSKHPTHLGRLLIQLVRGPVKIVSFAIFLHIGLLIYQWPDWIDTIFSKALQIIVAISVTYTIVKFVDLLINYWEVRRTKDSADPTFDTQLIPIVRKTLKLFVMIVAVLVTCSNLGLNITGLIASLSIGGLAIGLAAQDTLANLFGAVAIFLDKPFRVGDRITFDTFDGFVESIGLRSTRVRNLDGHLITVPNKAMGNATVTNITKRPHIRTVMNIGITYNTPSEKAKRAVQLLEEIYRAHPMTQDVWISFNKFADFSLNILVIHWWNSVVYKDYLEGMQELNLTIKKQFDEENIVFAFPTQTLYVKQDSIWQMNPPSYPAS